MYKYLMCALLAFMIGDSSALADDDREIRENPEMESGPASVSIDYPRYICLDANHIDMNGADWSDMAGVFARADSIPVTIVHIGDSHLQADMGTAVTRNRLGAKYGRLRGRGLIIPFRLAGTNQPVDYKITSHTSFTQSRLLKTPWPTKMGFTGIGISPSRSLFDLTVETAERFDAITIYYTGDTLQVVSLFDGDSSVPFVVEPSYKSIRITLAGTHNTLEMALKAPLGTTIHGLNPSLGTTGLAYHVIGNNGAAFSSYSGVGDVGNDVSEMFEPDLIIVSLGTNEAFGKITDSDFRRTIDNLVTELHMASPDAQLLLVTPQECHRRTTVRRRRRGRRRSAVSFSVNTNVKRMRDVIVAYGRDNHIPVYDWYAVAGGDGSSHKWISDSYINTDHIHLTAAGYRLQGNLFTDALIERLDAE